jgi:uncharacterized membrane protein YoaK (UPF0700 family)
MSVGIYGQFFYMETLFETEIMLGIMLFAMGLQNGLTASISNFAVKTTHLTGTTTDLGILFSMFTKKEFRENKELRGKAKLLSTIAIAYLGGAIISGFLYFYTGFQVFYIVSVFLTIVISYDLYKIRLARFISVRNRKNAIKVYKETKTVHPAFNLNSFTERKERMKEETA